MYWLTPRLLPTALLYFPGFWGHRQLPGGALRLARKTGSELGVFICRYFESGRHLIKGGPIILAADPQEFDIMCHYLSGEIETAPGRWCAADLLPLMPLLENGGQQA